MPSKYKHIKLLSLLLVGLIVAVTLNAQLQPSATSQVPAPQGTQARLVPAAYGTGVPVNYVRTWEPQWPYSLEGDVVSESRQVNEVHQTTQYVDGLGRLLQTVSKKLSNNQTDIVVPVYYDAFGRESHKFLPYVSGATDGSLKTDPFADQYNFYTGIYSSSQPAIVGEQFFYNKTVLEASPLNRPVKTFAPGNSWAGSEGGGSEHAVNTQYLINNANDQVRIWYISSNTLTYLNNDIATNIPTNISSSEGGGTAYDAGQLYKTVTTDEQNHAVVEYKDKEDHVVLKKVQIGNSIVADYSGQDANWLCTYYVYDDFGLLRFVIPPKAWAALYSNGINLTADIVNELCFRYEYDSKSRMIAKKVPGAGWVYMVYDKRDRLVFTQDANMRNNNNGWMVTLYDEFNRPVQTAMVSNYVGTRNDLQDYVDGITFGNATVGQQSISLYPVPSWATLIPLTYTFYDNYNNTNKTYNTGNNYKLDVNGNNAYVEALPSSQSQLTKGVVTATRVRVIENPSNLAQGQWLETVTYYDDKGRPIQVQADNAKAGVDINTMRYDFTGKVLTTYQVHHNPAASTTISTKTNLQYDHAGRLLSISKTLNDNTATTRVIARNTYDELGQLVTKKLGQKSVSDLTELEALDYSYNIRGWLQGINKAYANTNTSGNTSKWFGMQLSYDYGFTQSQYNGNIAGTIWKTRGSDAQRAYGYAYDPANRLLKGDFTQNTSGWNQSAGLNYNMQMGTGINDGSAYDANGNILAMTQYGFKIGGNAATPIDNLTYTYNANSNKLKNVIDANNDASTTLGDFRSSQTYMNALGTKTVNAVDYDYDANGNMVKDLNKDIAAIPLSGGGGAGITYNHLNLPYQITVTGKGTITYTYDAAGNKLRKTTLDNTTSPAKTTITDYIGGAVYEQVNNVTPVLQFIPHEEGRFRPVSNSPFGGWGADYFIKDHLGNVRMVLTDEIKQDVYPAATLEGDITNSSSAAYVENQYYNINGNAIVNNPASLPNTYANNNGNPPYNNNPNSNTTATSAKMYKLNGATGDKTGLGITLKVMAGDNVDIRGKSFWHNNGTVTNNYPITNNILDFLTAFAGTSAVSSASHSGVTGALLNNTPTTTSGLNSWLSNLPSPTNKPKAYINWILFDEQFKPVTTGSSSGFDGVDIADQIKSHANTVNIAKNGFLYVYCSNESNQDVFFDNLQVTHTKGPLVEETHYYPFGLTMSGISSKAAGSLENRRKFNKGSELASKEFSDGSGLDLYDAHFRQLDPQLGRFWQIDPLAVATLSISTFAFANNNPISINDPFGLVGDSTDKNGNVWKGLQDVTVTSHPKRNQGGNWLGSFANGYSKKEQDGDRGYQNMYYYRKVNHSATVRGWDNADYKAHAQSYQLWDKSEEESRKTQLFVVGVMAGPLMSVSYTGLLWGTGQSLASSASVMATDAGIQYVEKGSVNPIQVLGANLGPLGYALTGATTFNTNANGVPIIGLDNNASIGTILTSTLFNSIGAGMSNTMREGGFDGAAGPISVLPAVVGDFINSLITGNSRSFMIHP